MAEVQAEGCLIHYEELGSGDPLLLLHGLGSCIEDWELQIPAFSRTRRVIALDLRGHGASGKPSGPYSIALLARDVRAVLQAAAAAPAHVVGLSLGGMVAFQLAVDAPEVVRSLVIVNSAPEVIPRTLREHSMLAVRRALLGVFGLPRLAGTVARMNFPRADQIEWRRRLEQRVAGNDAAAYQATMSAIVGWTVADRIGTISCPTLIISGDHDYTPVSHKQAYAAKIPGAQVRVIENSRHVTPVDQSEVFNDVVLRFLDARGETAGTGVA